MVLGVGTALGFEMLRRRKKKKKKKLTEAPESQGPAPTRPSEKSEPKINYLDPMPKLKPREGGPKPAPMPNQPRPKKGKEKFREVPKAKKKKGKKEDKKPEIISVKDGGMLTKTVSSKKGSNSQGMRGTGAAIRGTKFKGVF